MEPRDEQGQDALSTVLRRFRSHAWYRRPHCGADREPDAHRERYVRSMRFVGNDEVETLRYDRRYSDPGVPWFILLRDHDLGCCECPTYPGYKALNPRTEFRSCTYHATTAQAGGPAK